MNYKIYKITNVATGKSYIGYTKFTLEKRWGNHLKCLKRGVNRKLYDAMRKYGIENFEMETIDEITDATQDECLQLETLYIAVFDAVENGYNMTYGGLGGSPIGRSMKGKTCYDKWLREVGKEEADRRKIEMFRKVADANRRNPPHVIWTDEQRRKKSEQMRIGGYKPPRRVVYGSNHQFFGKHHTDESKRKCSESKVGKSYVEVMGDDVAKQLISRRRVSWTGKNNPNFVDIPRELLYELVAIEKRKIVDVAAHFGVRHGTIIDKCKKYFGKKPQELKRENQT